MSGIIITVSAQKGGSGKTLRASLLAMAWHRNEGAEVAVLDVDPQGSLGEWYERREAALGGDWGPVIGEQRAPGRKRTVS